MTDRESEAATALAKCTFLPGFWDKRFVQNMAVVTEATERQIEWLWLLVWRYRRQIGDADLVAEAERKAK